LDNFPVLLKLTDAIFSDNKITSVGNIAECLSLKLLDLQNNMITNLEEIEKLNNMIKLRRLSMTGNPIYDTEG